MKLHIKRDQKQEKGFFGGNKGVTFSLYCRAEYLAEEKSLIERYKLDDFQLAEYHIKGLTIPLQVTVGGLERGFTSVIQDLGELQQLEDNVEQACRTLKGYLAVASTFGGETVIDI